MGQLVAKFKEFREKLELSHEKTKHVSTKNSRPEQKSLTGEESSENKNKTRDYGAIAETDKLPEDDVIKKLQMLECVLENQRKFLEDHDIKIQEIETVLQKIVADKVEKDNEKDSDLQYKPEALFDRLIGSASEGDEDAKPRDLWKMFQCHAELLDDHSLRLEENVTKIEIIREMLDDKKGEQEKSLRKKFKEYEGVLKKRCGSYEKLKKEVEDQLQLQRKLQDNLVAGFIVGFVIMVMICMLPRTFLASG